MKLENKKIKTIIERLIKGQDYRIEVVTLIDIEFIQHVIEFFKKVVNAKLKGKNISLDWYRRELLHAGLSKEEIALNSGLNMKTISNMYNTANREVVVDASLEHYDALVNIIKI